MAFRYTHVRKLYNISKFSTILHVHPCLRHQSTAAMRLFPPRTDTLAKALKGVDITMGRLNLDGLVTLPTYKAAAEVETRTKAVEMVSEELKRVGKEWVTYKEYVGIIQEFCEKKREVYEFGKMLDDLGVVIVFGNYVCLRPHQVAKTLQNLVRPPVSAYLTDPRRMELELMEQQKAEIDQKAKALVRRELWAGLGFMVVQTGAFMRLTFWELSWDVMEPICCYVTSAYFMLGYAFFLRTSKEPSFEGFYESRFNAKLKRLIKAREFDLERYNELREMFYPHSCSSSKSSLRDAKLIKFDLLP
ncbi:hypothetical protein vseg_015833 [Gypsophila vaccaria]